MSKRKKLSFITYGIFVVISLVMLVGYVRMGISLSNKETIKITVHDTIFIVKQEHKLPNLSIQQFKNIIAEMESGNNYNAYSAKYFGKYQISQTNIALSDYDLETYMTDKEVQEWIMDDLFYEYLYHTVSYCNKYNGTRIFNLDIDTWVILYGCHCAGYTKTKKWLDKPIKNRLYYQMINFNNRRK